MVRILTVSIPCDGPTGTVCVVWKSEEGEYDDGLVTPTDRRSCPMHSPCHSPCQTQRARLVSWLLAYVDRSHRTGFDKINLLVLSGGFFIWDEVRMNCPTQWLHSP